MINKDKVAELRQKVSTLNKRAEDNNAKRTQALSNQNILKDRVVRGLEDYNKTYGTSITLETFAAEYQAVYSSLELGALELEKVFAAIDLGNVAGVESVLGSIGTIDEVKTHVAEAVVTEVDEPVKAAIINDMELSLDDGITLESNVAFVDNQSIVLDTATDNKIVTEKVEVKPTTIPDTGVVGGLPGGLEVKEVNLEAFGTVGLEQVESAVVKDELSFTNETGGDLNDDFGDLFKDIDNSLLGGTGGGLSI